MGIFAIYPLALAIRATNVYEEKALGISESTESDAKHGLQHLKQEEGYIGLHLKEQLAVSYSQSLGRFSYYRGCTGLMWLVIQTV